MYLNLVTCIPGHTPQLDYNLLGTLFMSRKGYLLGNWQTDQGSNYSAVGGGSLLWQKGLGHEEMTKKTRYMRMGFFVGCRSSESDRVRSSDMAGEFKVELLLLCMKRNPLRRLGIWSECHEDAFGNTSVFQWSSEWKGRGFPAEAAKDF